MPAPSSVREVLNLWPNDKHAAYFIGVAHSLVRQWRSRDHIPADQWSKVIAAAEACGFPGVTYARLADIARGRISASGPGAPAKAPSQE